MKKFMTAFEEATLFHPHLQELDIILDAESMNAENRQVFMRIWACDSNRQELTNIITPSGVILDEFPVTEILVNTPIIQGKYRFCITPQHQIDRRMKWLRCQILDVADDTLVLAEKWVYICKTVANNNQVLVRWMNFLGGYDAWLFDDIRTDTINHLNTVSFEQYASRVPTIVKREMDLTIDVRANMIPAKQIKGVASLAQAQFVYVDDFNDRLIDYRTVIQDNWIPCQVQPASVVINETVSGMYEIQLKIKLCDLNS